MFEDFWHSDETRFLAAPGHEAPLGDATLPPGHLLFQTSGSTGVPKWIALSKEALLASALAVNAHLDVAPDSVWGLVLPVYHVGGFGVLARARQADCGVEVFSGKWDPSAFTRWCESKHLTHTSLVPTQVHDLVQAACRAPAALRAIVVGGGELPEATGRAARALGWPVLASYGMTEAASQIATQPLSALADPFATQPIPVLPHWQVRTTPTGILQITGPALFSGAWSPETRFVSRTDPWHTTSDLASITPKGIVSLGRADDLVKILGELVSPSAVERGLIVAHPGLAGSLVVIALPDARRGHHLVPVCARHDPSLAGLVEAHNRSVPGHLRFSPPMVMTFPRSSLGKPLRVRIRHAAIRQLGLKKNPPSDGS